MRIKERVSFSQENLSIDEIIEWHNTAVNALRNFKEGVKSGQIINSSFTFMTSGEIEEYFSNKLDELDKAAAFSIMASVEASLRMDYLGRVYDKRKDSLSRKFRDLYKKNLSEARLDDILSEWKNECTRYSQVIGRFNSALRYRHWLAHGRYWVPKWGQMFDFSDIYEISADVIDHLIAVGCLQSGGMTAANRK